MIEGAPNDIPERTLPQALLDFAKKTGALIVEGLLIMANPYEDPDRERRTHS